MAAQSVAPPVFNLPFTDAKGMLTDHAQRLLADLYSRTGGADDKVDAAHALALAAVPQTTQVVAAGGLRNGGALNANVGVTLYRAIDLTANLPTTGNAEGDWAYATDGRKTGEGAGAGTGVPVWWSGSHWYAVDSGAVVTT
jgi:hypothetical protein